MSAAELQQLAPGEACLLDVTPDEYYELDGFSQSLATTLTRKSPLHAWTQHPKLGGRKRKPTKTMNRGTVVHQLVLGKGKAFKELDFDDYRTKLAQEARDRATAAGLVPILKHELEAAREIAAAVTEQLERRGIRLDGESEVAIQWCEPTPHGPVQCHGLFDHLRLAAGTIIDLKICENASPDAVQRASEDYGYAIQAAAYRRALGMLEPRLVGRTEFLFAFCEPEPPYAMNVCRPDGAMRELGERRWDRALAEWAYCVATNTWPAYGNDINQLSPPTWALMREGYAA